MGECLERVHTTEEKALNLDLQMRVWVDELEKQVTSLEADQKDTQWEIQRLILRTEMMEEEMKFLRSRVLVKEEPLSPPLGGPLEIGMLLFLPDDQEMIRV